MDSEFVITPLLLSLFIIFSVLTLVNTIITCIILISHFKNWHHGTIQIAYGFVFALIPFFSLSSLITLYLPMAAMYVEYIRRAFETIVVFMFLQVILQLCGGHAYFVNYFTNFKPSSTKRIVLYGCYVATIQFIVVIFLVANVAFVLEGAWGLYGENQWRLDRGYLYCKILVFASTAVGFGSLFVFYHHTKHYLLKYEIVKKFLCIKVLILLPIIQDVLIKIFIRFNWIKGTEFFEAEDIGNRLNACLVIAEMFVGVFFLAATFSYVSLKDWKPALQYTNDKSMASMQEDFESEEEAQDEHEKDQLLEETASDTSLSSTVGYQKDNEA